jgi:tRNA (mo5U34)-methyltransferase
VGFPAERAEQLASEMRSINWFHTIDLGGGLITPGRDPSGKKLATLDFPADLTGKTVLDIGAWDGFFSFEAERRGASRVLATDQFCWVGDGWGSKAGFEFARRALHSKVEDRVIDPMDLSPEKVGTFDVVLFLGVLYHMRHPLLALERVASVTKGFLLLETHIVNRFSRPMIEFYPNDELVGDPTNWCGANKAAVEAMLRVVGFKRIESRIHQSSIVHRLVRATRDRFGRGLPFSTSLHQARLVCHAWR